MVCDVLLQTRHPSRQLLLLSDGLALEAINQAELLGREVTKVPFPHPLKELVELGLELRTAEKINESDGKRGSAAGNPEEGVLERGAPGGAKERGCVILGEDGSLLVVFLVVLDVFFGEEAELVVVFMVLGEGLDELCKVSFLLGDPATEETMETILISTWHFLHLSSCFSQAGLIICKFYVLENRKEWERE